MSTIKTILTISCALAVQITAYAQPGFSSNYERFQNAYAEIEQQRQADALRAQIEFRQREIENRIEDQQRQIERQIRLQRLPR